LTIKLTSHSDSLRQVNFCYSPGGHAAGRTFLRWHATSNILKTLNFAGTLA